MPQGLPIVSGRDAVKALTTLGFEVVCQKGSHIALFHAQWRRTVTVPDHKELDRGTLKSILRQANVSVDQSVSALR